MLKKIGLDNTVPYFERFLEVFTRRVLQVWGRYNDALKNYSEIIKYYYEINDKQGLAKTLNSIGLIYYEKEEYDEARKKYEEFRNCKEDRKLTIYK